MTAAQIALVQSRFEVVRPRLEPAALMFYGRLFELDPSLRGLFHASREDQARKLAQALSVVVKGIDRPAQLRGAVEALGRRHAVYGVRDEHCATVGEALIWMLEKGLGEAFTPETRAARIAAYGWLAFVMWRGHGTDELQRLRGPSSSGATACLPRSGLNLDRALYADDRNEAGQPHRSQLP